MNGFFIAIGLALLLWVLALFFLQSIIRRRTSPDYILGLLQEEVRQLQADIDEVTEQNLQLLEDKIKILRDISSEAEKRIVVYGRELEKREKESRSLSALEKQPPPANPVHREKQEDKQAETAFPKPRSSVPLIASLEARNPALEAASSAYLSQTGQTLSELPKIIVSRDITSKSSDKERIIELSKAGFSPETIAKRLGLTMGEVVLYVNIRKKK